MFPVKLTIREDSLEVDCKFLFFFSRKYRWRKEQVCIRHRFTIGKKVSSIIILRHNSHERILFESFSITVKMIDQIVSVFSEKGYDVDSKVGR
jgi:hypothetical protein